jgi:hypothetical protein
MSLGQLTSLPASLAANPFHRLIVKFSRAKSGSYETMFTIETFLLRYSWAGLLLLFALVLPPLEEVDYVSTLVRLSTMVYPFFFIWSLTRVAGVELMQLVLEGHWTGEILASPVSDRDLTVGFIAPLGLIIRQYLLISIFSLTLFGLETQVIVRDENGRLLMGHFIRYTIFYYDLFFSSVAWITFIYLGRLLAEVRLRNGLIKGLATLVLLLGGIALFAGYVLLFWRYSDQLTRLRVLVGLALLTGGLSGAAYLFYRRLARNFRQYLYGQLDIDLLIFDDADPHASAWQFVAESGQQPATPVSHNQ